MAFKSLIIGSLLAGLFVVAFLGGMSELAFQNNKTNVLLDNDPLNRTITSINNSIRSIDTTVNKTKEAFESEETSLVTGVLLIGSILNAGKTFSTVIINVFTGVFTVSAEVLGVPPIAIVVLTGILLITIVLLSWRLIKTGN